MQPVNLLTPLGSSLLKVLESLRFAAYLLCFMTFVVFLVTAWYLDRVFLCWLPVAAISFLGMVFCGAHEKLREQHGPLLSLRYLMVPSSVGFVLQPGDRGALQAKYWKAASPGPVRNATITLCRW